jgi:uncharacterized membrane protein
MKSTAPDTLEKGLAGGTALVAVLALTAVIRGHSEWSLIDPVIWLHLGFLVIALVLTPILLLRQRGDRLHRVTGWTWAVAMVATAAISLKIRVITPGHLSIIHVLSVVVLVTVPTLVFRARRHQVAAHRRGVRVVVAAGLIVAGLATFPSQRLLGHWLFG